VKSVEQQAERYSNMSPTTLMAKGMANVEPVSSIRDELEVSINHYESYMR